MVKVQKKTIPLIVILVFTVLVLLCIVFPLTTKAIFHQKQDDLATYLGLDKNNYDRLGFPNNYFYYQLKIGMTKDEVHKIVRGFELVCLGQINNETYYYFSSDEDRAKRFMIFYDDEDRYFDFLSEDPNSREFGSPINCKQGQWDQ